MRSGSEGDGLLCEGALAEMRHWLVLRSPEAQGAEPAGARRARLARAALAHCRGGEALNGALRRLAPAGKGEAQAAAFVAEAQAGAQRNWARGLAADRREPLNFNLPQACCCACGARLGGSRARRARLSPNLRKSSLVLE